MPARVRAAGRKQILAQLRECEEMVLSCGAAGGGGGGLERPFFSFGGATGTAGRVRDRRRADELRGCDLFQSLGCGGSP